MIILWDECVDARYQREFQARLPKHRYLQAQQVGLGGGDAILQSVVDEPGKDLMVAEIAAQRGYDVVITTDKAFLHHIQPDQVPVPVISLDVGQDDIGRPIPPSVENLRLLSDSLERELENLADAGKARPTLTSIKVAR